MDPTCELPCRVDLNNPPPRLISDKWSSEVEDSLQLRVANDSINPEISHVFSGRQAETVDQHASSSIKHLHKTETFQALATRLGIKSHSQETTLKISFYAFSMRDLHWFRDKWQLHVSTSLLMTTMISLNLTCQACLRHASHSLSILPHVILSTMTTTTYLGIEETSIDCMEGMMMIWYMAAPSTKFHEITCHTWKDNLILKL